ncbi:ribonuclease J, partial [bacterium]|nr:ribonuclease J [bacterium]
LIETKTTAILIDCGLMFSELDHFGVEFVIPNFSHLLAKKDKIKAIFATHGHEDHIGAIPFALKAGIRAPIHASHFTSLMVRERLKEAGHENTVPIQIMNPGTVIEVGDLRVTPANVNHSIIDAYALFIDTPVGKIIHTGDFKLDPSPHFGDVMEWDVFKKAGEEGVLLLLSDSTNVEREQNDIQDTDISIKMEELLRSAKGLTLVSMFSSNVGRMANILRIAERMGKKIALTGRSMEQNVRLAMEHGAISFPRESMIEIEDIDQYDRNRVIVFSTGCQGEPRSALNRIARNEHAHVSLNENDLVILSSSQIPGNDVAISKLINELFRRGAKVLYDAIEDVHTSGHATRPELKKMIETVKPRFFIPIHGEYRHLVHHAELAVECGLADDRVCVIQNGEAVELDGEAIRFVGEIPELRVLVDGRDGVEITKDLLRDRRRLAETGVVVCMLARERDSGRILTKPEIHAKGLINSSLEPWLIDEALKMVDRVIADYKKELRQGVVDPAFAENIRIELRRFFERNTGKKPTVVPMVMDV